MTLSYSTTGSPPPADSLAPLGAFLDSERAALAAGLAAAPPLAALPAEAAAALADRVVGSLLATLGDMGATARWVAELLLQPELAGLDERAAHDVFVALRRVILDASLRAVMAGVPDAQEGIHTLMAQVNITHMAVIDFFQRASETDLRLFRELVEHSPDAVVLARLDGTILHANAAFRQRTTFGDGAQGITLGDLGVNDPAVQREIQESLEASGSWQGLIPYTRPDGSEAIDHNIIFSIRDAEGRPQALAIIARDVSDQVRREAELRAVNARMEQSLATSPLATIEWDRSGTIRRWNPAAERIFGWSAAEAIGRNIFTLLVPDMELDQVQAMADAVLRGEASNSSRNLNRRKDGQLITCQWYTAVLRDERGNVVGALSQTEDVSDDLRAEEALRASQEELIQAQQAALRELSTPLIPLAEGVVAMPLVGSIDSARAQLVIESLLEGVSQNHARTAILDITGVPVVDTQVANALIRAAQAVKLLGAQVVLTGIRPEVAQTLVGLGVDLTGIVTRGSFQAGISFAFGTRG
ncbi:MAG TPA: PAS domain S-box protein [Roseiflexaceae bacterium]|nr:PAS domain S-box protein [Roseiflexaceae bacterium]